MLARVNFKPARARLPSRARTAGVSNPVTGLIFPSNGVAGGDIRLLWNGSNLLSRTSHTVLWLANYVQQSGYYAVTWHSPNTGTWDNGAYSLGMHPFPCDGAFNSSGGATNGTGSGGTVHYQEIAGNTGTADDIASNSSPGPQDSFLVTKGVWYQSARVEEIVSGTTLRSTYYPDVAGNPTKFIRQDRLLSALGSAGSTPAFYFGCSDWSGDGSQNGETPSGTLRGLRLFSAPLAIADIQAEFSAVGNNTAGSSAGAAAVWYINDNPTPSDVTDKSAAGHSPSWANSNRPTLYTG